MVFFFSVGFILMRKDFDIMNNCYAHLTIKGNKEWSFTLHQYTIKLIEF